MLLLEFRKGGIKWTPMVLQEIILTSDSHATAGPGGCRVSLTQ